MPRDPIEGDGQRRTENEQSAEREQIHVRLNEVWMLVDYVAGQSDQGLRRIDLENPATSQNYKPKELLADISAVQDRLDKGCRRLDDRSTLEVMRDALNLLVRPASGLTVAYTTLVSGPLRGRGASRFELAKLAYPNLAFRATMHRGLQVLLLVFAVGVTGLATWESAKVALGKALLQNLDVLQAKQDKLNTEKSKLELKAPTQAQRHLDLDEIDRSHALPLAAYRVCDRPTVIYAHSAGLKLDEVLKQQQIDPGPRMLVYETAEESDLCGQDDVLRANLGIAHGDIDNYMQNWPAMMGSAFAATRNLMVSFRSAQQTQNPRNPAQQDIELRVAPVLLVWGNFVLPIIFSTIGSAIFVILDHYNKVRGSTLDPRDFFLAPVRLALGLIVGACVGLFFSAYGPVSAPSGTPTASALISSLTLTASGIAFLAGFGVETVFTLLEAVIARVFSLPNAQKT